jgi:predicted nucleotidyltransferase
MERDAPDLAELHRIAERHGVVLLLQFGSSVTGTVHARSDVDLAALFDGAPRSLTALADLRHALQHLFPGREVDLAVIDHADPLFLRKIMERCRLLHGDPRRFQRLRIYAFKRYQDHRRYLALERQFVARRFGTGQT